MKRFLQDKGRTSKPQVWEVMVVKNTVQVMWGQLGGAMQETTQTFNKVLNEGKKNEKDGEQQAKEYFDREIKKRVRRGYREVDLKTNEPLKSSQASASSIEDFGELPDNLRFFKPLNSLSVYLEKLIESGDAVFLRKRDGMMHVIAFDHVGIPTMYGANLLKFHKDEPSIPWLERYPHLYDELIGLGVPHNTILLGEIVTGWGSGHSDDDGCDVDAFDHVESVVKAKVEQAIKNQEEGGKLGYCIWDIAFWDGECLLQTMRAGDRFQKMFDLVADGVEPKWTYLTAPELITEGTREELIQMAKDRKWEGWVVVDPNAVYDDKAFNFAGKAQRPKHAGKLKPEYECDFIVRWNPDNGIGRWGKGKKSNGVGSVQAYLWDPETGKEVEISLVGGGLSDANVKKFAVSSLYPMVWAISFDSWTPKGSLRFSEFVRVRDDKTPEECTIDQKWKTE